MIQGLHVEVLLALGYAAFLLAIAFVFEIVARRSHKRAHEYKHAGFIYFRELDYWECPAGSQLIRLNTDPHRRMTSYRAPASACNACSLKLNCTDSNEGRLLEKRLDLWIESELRRFHRGLSLTLLVLATSILVAAMFRYSEAHDRAALVALLIPLTVLELKLLRAAPVRDPLKSFYDGSSQL
jgi:hypothetical protein